MHNSHISVKELLRSSEEPEVPYDVIILSNFFDKSAPTIASNTLSARNTHALDPNAGHQLILCTDARLYHS